MVSLEQLGTYVNQDHCMQLIVESKRRGEQSEKWLCQRELEDFWSGHCIEIEESAGIEICNEDGISVFIGKCVLANGFKVCP